MAPMADFEPILLAMRQPHMRDLSPVDAAWLAATSHIRHRHTEYDALLAEGYDHDAARFFVLDDMQDVLADWGCSRPIVDDVSDHS